MKLEKIDSSASKSFWIKLNLLKIVDALVVIGSLGNYKTDYSFEYLKKNLLKK